MITWLNELAEQGVFFKIQNDQLKILTKKKSISQDLLEEIKSKKEAIRQYLISQKDILDSKDQFQNIPPLPQLERYSISDAQKRMWVLTQLDEKSFAYNISSRMTLPKEYGITNFKKAIYAVVERHEILRTIFEENTDGEVFQRVLDFKEINFKIKEQDYRKETNSQTKIDVYVERDKKTPFDLKSGPLLRVVIFRITDQQYHFYFSMHHIISDGWSMQVLKKDLLTYYNAFEKGETPDLPALNIQYKDYSAWQLEQLKGVAYEQDKQFWLNQFSDEIPITDLPITKSRPPVKTTNGERVKTLINPEAMGKLKEFVKENGGSLFIGLTTVLNVLLHKYTNQHEFIVGTPVSGRNHKDLENQIGLFINIIPLRNRIHPTDRFIDCYSTVKNNIQDSFSHQNFSFGHLVEELNLARDPSRSTLFDVLVDLHNMEEVDRGTPNSSDFETIHYLGKTTSKVDIEIIFEEANDYISFYIGYNSDVYQREMIERFMKHYLQMLNAFLKSPSSKITEVNYLSAAEEKQLLKEFNTGSYELTNEDNLLRSLDQNVLEHPDRIALIHGEDKMSYNELERLSNQLADHIISEGINNSFIPVCMNRSFEMIIAIVAVLKSGNAFVPINPKLPQERIAHILKDVQCHLVLCDTIYNDLFPKVKVLNLNVFDYNLFSEKKVNVNIPDNQPAYCIYTSGTSGKPKGVVISHASLSNYIHYASRTYTNNTPSVFTLVTSLSFDLTITSIFTPLITGGTIDIIPNYENHLDELKVVAERNFDVIKLTPSHLTILLNFCKEITNDTDTKDKVFILGGEALLPSMVDRLFNCFGNKTTIWNEYGPTESTVGCISKKIDYNDYQQIHIGKPIANTSVFIVNNESLVPVGVSGEICIGGKQLALEYLNRPELTKEKFIDNPFVKGEKLYRSGDLGRWLSNGEIEYLGREDDQVKIRGYRIELTEIKNVLEAYTDISEAVVVVEEEKDNKKLLGYVVGEEEIDFQKVNKYLLDRFPEYMIPSAIYQVDSIPLTGNGKVNTGLLKEKISETETNSKYKAPRNSFEYQLVEIWSALLGCDPNTIGIDIGFFQLGGNSLHIMELHFEIKRVFSQEVSIAELFQNTTIRSQSKLLSGEENELKTSDAELDKLSANFVKAPANEDETDIAVIGMSIRTPGANSVFQFWDNLKNGVEPLDQFSKEELYNAGISKRALEDQNYVRSGFFLKDKEFFDASFFGYLPDEAKMMDPQIRIFHELVWNALEDAGYDPFTYQGLIGLYAGARSNINWQVYNKLVNQNDKVDSFTAAKLEDKDFVSSLIAYRLNLKGGVYTLNTACSTSLVTINQAIKSLLSGENHIALAGGVSLKSPDKRGYFYRDGMINSKDGHTRPFDSESSGTVESEGGGVVVLKRLSEAKKDGDNVLAVIKGSAINNDGNRKVGFTAPSIDGQIDVIKMAQRMAGVSPDTIGYIETHGTATKLGDVIEFEALRQVFGDTVNKNSCALGSVKSNMGHLDTAAGITGLIKTILCLKHRQLVPSLHFKEPNKELNYEDSPFYVNTALQDWSPAYDGPLRAGVSSFGIGGTNAHVVLEEFYSEEKTNEGVKPQVVVLSAETPQGLQNQKNNLKEFLLNRSEIRMENLAWTLQNGRRSFLYRTSFVADTLSSLVQELEKEDSGYTKAVVNQEHRNIVFMFPGQGSQYLNMGKGLYETETVFKNLMDQCFEIAFSINEKDYKKILFSIDETQDQLINQTQNTQPLLFFFEYCLAKQLEFYGLFPNMMIGHSIGEYVAACLSGVITLEDAIRLVIFRGEMIQKIDRGTMLSVGLTEEEVQMFLGTEISIAAVNTNHSCVLSGNSEEIQGLKKQLDSLNVTNRILKTSHAFHSGMMDAIEKEFLNVIASIDFQQPEIPYVSNVTGKIITENQVKNKKYWFDHLRNTVKFYEGLKTILTTEPGSIFIEVGPGKTLTSFVRQFKSKDFVYDVTNFVRHPQEVINDTAYLLSRLGKLWEIGLPIDWKKLYNDNPLHKISLPTYPFTKTKYPLGENLNTLISQKITQTNTSKLEDSSKWFYTPTWKQENLIVKPTEFVKNECYLFFLDDLGYGEGLISKVRTTNQTISVRPGNEFIKENEYGYIINPEEESHYELLFDDLTERGIAIKHITHLFSLIDNPLIASQDLGFYSLLFIAKSLLGIEEKYHTQITIVTNGLKKVIGNEKLNGKSALVTGISLIIPQENPMTTTKCVDIRLEEDKDEVIGELYTEISCVTSSVKSIAYRYRNRWIESYRSIELKETNESTSKLKHKGVYFITGGLGKLGYLYAKYLQEEYEASLILIGRSMLSETSPGDKKSKRLKLLQDGGNVLYYTANIAVEEEVRLAIKNGESAFGKIDGVIHTAGSNSKTIRKAIHLLKPKECKEQFQAKLNGTNVLTKIFQSYNLDFCVFSSSLASIIGGKEFATYASANRYLDQVAQEGIIENSISINYDGLNFNNEDYELGLSKEESLLVLENALSYPKISQLIISVSDLNTRFERWVTNTSEKLDNPISNDLESDLEINRSNLSSIYSAPETEFEIKLSSLFEEFFGIKGIGVNDDFFELGGDSLKAMTLSNSIYKLYKVELDLKEFFLNPNIRDLAREIEQQHKSKVKNQEIKKAKYQETI